MSPRCENGLKVRGWTRSALALAAVGALLPAAAARADAAPAPANPCADAPATAPFYLNTNRPGLIDLQFYRAQGVPVTYYECVAEQARTLGVQSSAQDSNVTSFYAATSWKCSRQTRRFVATASVPGGLVLRGFASTQTPSCAHRFTLDVPSRVKRGQLARIRIVDGWRIGGIRTKLCITAPAGRRTCQSVGFAKAVGVATRRFRPATRGRWRVELRVTRHRVRDSIGVGVQRGSATAALPTLLATGDSTMQNLDSFLSDEFGNEATVISDVRPGLALSGADDWAAIATAQAAERRPDATVLSIGANEGYPSRGADGVTHECCDTAWTVEYARRMRSTMLTYSRHRRARVLVLTIQAPRNARRAAITTAVNSAIVRAASGLPGVRVLRMDLLFSPTGYSDVIRYRGQDVHVREPDGIHLNVSGSAIAAQVVTQALREH